MEALQKHIEQIKELRDLHKVKSLFAFGSVVDNQLKASSDIDLIVDIESDDPIEYADNYFELKFCLADVLKRNIDLLESKAIKNSFLRSQIDITKALIYGK